MEEQKALEEELSRLPAILTVKETAEFLRVDNSTIYRKIACGELKAFMPEGEDYNILRSDLTEYCLKSFWI